MKTCVIFCAADFDCLAQPIGPEDCVLAADGGLRHTNALGITPDGILGDFDSLGYVPREGRVFPVEKDDTDAMLAVRQGLDMGFRRFVLYGALGGERLDHTVANFQLLGFLAAHGAQGFLVGEKIMATVLSGGTLEFPDSCTGILSVFCQGAPARGVSIRGLKYELENGTLSADFPLGVSNAFCGKKASICAGEGSLLILWDRCCGFPVRL